MATSLERETTPVEFAGWRGEYFANTDLRSEPVMVRDDEKINFDWGANPPAPEVPAENFSVRWTISREVPAGMARERPDGVEPNGGRK